MLVVGVIAVTLAFTVGVFIIQNMFNQPITITNNSLYEKAEIQVDKLENIKYESNYNSNSLDIYYPKDSNEQLPVLFLVYGGSFVAGDNEGVAEFATYIIADQSIYNK